MSIDQQILLYEDRISQLEQMKHNLILQSSDSQVKENVKNPENDLGRINIDLDENYQHIAILKIRKMMGF